MALAKLVVMLLYIHCAIISLGKRDLVALLCLPSDVMWLLVFCDSSSRYI